MYHSVSVHARTAANAVDEFLYDHIVAQMREVTRQYDCGLLTREDYVTEMFNVTAKGLCK